MGAKWNLDKITAAFTDAAVDPTRWNTAMEVACKVTGSSGVALFLVRGPSPLPMFPITESLLPSFDTYIREGWIHRDERYRAQNVFKKKAVFTEFDFTTPDDIAQHPYYQEFLAPFGLRWFAGVKIACGDDLWCLSMQNSIERGPFSRAELTSFEDLSVRLSSAAALGRTLGFAKAEATLEAFQISGRAAVLIGPRGDVFRVNRAAEMLLGADLQIRNGKLISSDRLATAALHRAVYELLWLRHASSPPIVLPRTSGRPMIAYPMSLPSLAQDFLGPARAAVVLVDLASQVAPAEAILRSVFGLTPAETKLAKRIQQGESLESAADAIGISYDTARNQLKSVFAKTETKRQGEFIALANRLANNFSDG
jgi:DNA-binding CsgD family transcriptional regulator